MRRGTVLLAGCLALTATACSTGAAARDGSGTYLSADKRIAAFAPAQRKAAPALAGRTLAGASYDLAAQRGKVVVINVWGTYCGPCRTETPVLARAAADLAPRGVTFVGIDTRDDDSQARAFVARYRVPYPSLIDGDGDLVVRFNGTVPPSAVPSTLVLDRQGRIAARAIGAVDEAQLRSMIDPVLAEPA